MTIEYRYLRRAAPNAEEDNTLRGRAWVYGSPTMIGKAPYGFREVIRAGAGKKSVNDGDIVLLDNHEHRLPLARMSAGTLEMNDGADGGDWSAHPADTSYAADVVKNVRAGNYGGCSFGFEVIKDKWTDDKGNPASPMDGTKREIIEMKVHEISVCTFPAYGATTVSARDMVNAARGVQEERQASAERTPLTPANGSQESESEEGAEDRDASKPYGDVTYADPGYQADNKKRYPLDTKKHVKAAWSYINQAANAAKYTATQLASIKSKIKAAMAKNGVKNSDDESKVSAWSALCDFREMTEGYSVSDALEDIDFGVQPGEFVRSEDANTLAQNIKAAYDAATRVSAINLAVNLGIPDALPDHWGPNGEIGAIASDDAHRDMAAVYELAIELPATRTSLDIVQLAEPYLSGETRQKAEHQEPEVDPDLSDPEVLKQRFQDARDRLHALDQGNW